MKNNMIKYSLLIISILAITSCQKVIDVEVEEANENIILDASYNAETELVRVKVSRSAALFSDTGFPGIEDASIEIETPGGDIFQVPHVGNGVYEFANLTPSFNATYQMRAIIDGENYEASAFLPNPIPLDSLSQEFIEESLFGPQGYVVFMNLSDPGGSNFYRAVRIINGDTLNDLGDQFIFDNSFSEGNVQTVPFFSSRYEPSDTVVVQLRSYSEAAYIYFTDLLALAGDGGQSAAPANPRPNWNNGALGIFNTYGYDEKTIIIEE
jgi:hypothetical protein